VTERELRLRQRIDDLLDQREDDALVIARLRARLRGEFGRCRWCGRWGWGRACALHQDLERMERQLYG
jgi:hypothetical protein